MGRAANSLEAGNSGGSMMTVLETLLVDPSQEAQKVHVKELCELKAANLKAIKLAENLKVCPECCLLCTKPVLCVLCVHLRYGLVRSYAGSAVA